MSQNSKSLEDRLDSIELHLVDIKKDLSYHIKRTDDLQKMVTPVYKLYIFFNYLVKALIPISIIIGIILQYKGSK